MDTANCVKIGDRIKVERENRGLTIAVFSERIGISITSLCNLENGQEYVPLPVIIKIAEILGISLDYLIYGDRVTNVDVDKSNLIHMIEIASKEELKVIRDILLVFLPNTSK